MLPLTRFNKAACILCWIEFSKTFSARKRKILRLFVTTVKSRIEPGKSFGETTRFTATINLWVSDYNRKHLSMRVYSNNACSIALIKARQEATEDTIFVFCGDGVSDISAARHADVLFVRKDRDLEFYCKREDIPYIPFETFAEIERVVTKLVDGKSKLVKTESGFSEVVDV